MKGTVFTSYTFKLFLSLYIIMVSSFVYITYDRIIELYNIGGTDFLSIIFMIISGHTVFAMFFYFLLMIEEIEKM